MVVCNVFFRVLALTHYSLMSPRDFGFNDGFNGEAECIDPSFPRGCCLPIVMIPALLGLRA
jgi:hypothetical protein